MARRQYPISVATFVAIFVMVSRPVEGPESGGVPAGDGRPQGKILASARSSPKVFPPEAMDELLRMWEGQSKKLVDLEVDIYRVDKDLNWEDEAHFTGHAAFKSPDLAYVDYRLVERVRPRLIPEDQEQEDLRAREEQERPARYEPIARPYCARAKRCGTTGPT